MENINTPQKYFEQSLEAFFHPLLSTPLPSDRLYSKGHMWIKNDSASTATIGIDHVGAYFLQPVVSVVLPHTPSRVEQNSPCAWLVLREGTIALRSAVSGIGVESNTQLLDRPYFLLDDPYASGWILRIADTSKSGNDLLSSDDFTPLFHKEMAAIKEKFDAAFHKLQPVVGPTLYDGGEPVKSIYEILGQKKYFEIMSRLFSKA
jgi:glycine cleavage system H protein